jgi:PKD repeat protein
MQRFFTLFFFFSITSSQAQLNKVWDHRYGGKYDDFTDGIIATADGGSFVFGYSYSDSSGDKTEQLKGFQDYWVVKTDVNGVMEWNKSFGAADAFNYLTCGRQTQDGGFIVGGWTPADSSFDKSEDNRGGYDYWVIRMDALGNKLWDKTYGGNKDDVMTSVYATSDGGFILGGYTSSDSTGDKKTFRKGHVDYWVIKTDANGQYQWEKDYGGTKDDYLYRVVETYDGGYYFFGASSSDSSGDKSQDSKGTFDFWIIKTDANGNYMWDRDIGTPGDENTFQPFMDITLDNGAIMGTSSAYANASGDKTVVNWSVFSDFWIVRLDSVGTKLWDQRYGGIGEEDEFWNVWHTTDGGFLISGASYSDASGDKSEPNSQPLGVEQSWCIKVDGNGNKIWDKTMLNNDHNEGGMCTETIDGCVIINNYSSADSGGDKSEDSWNHSMDYFFAKYCIGGASPSSNFLASDTTICEQFCIDFTDQSANNPTSWQWSFPGGNPSSSTDQNPVNICYATSGIYDVTLIASNAVGSDTLVLAGYITVNITPAVNLLQSNDTLLTSPGFMYQWYESGNAIAGATDYFYVPLQEGNYSVVITDSAGCPGVDSIFFLFIASIQFLYVAGNPVREVLY